MLADLASAIIGITIALIIAFPLGEGLRKFPVPFYFVAILVVALHFIYRVTGAYIASAQVFLDVLNRAYLGVALLGIVMFIGVFDEDTSLRKKLQPIRAELSILSFIFICDHMIGYAPSYIPVLGRLASLRLGMALSIVCAIILAFIFVVLGQLRCGWCARKCQQLRGRKFSEASMLWWFYCGFTSCWCLAGLLLAKQVGSLLPRWP